MPRNVDLLKKIIGTKINDYKIVKYISSGGYGDVYEVVNSKGKRFAMKIPNDNTNSQKSIIEEYKMYSKLSDRDNGIINAKLSKHSNRYLMIMDLLGPSIGKFLKKYKKFELKTILLLTIQMLKILKYIHSNGYIHRDIKNYNFSIDRTNPDKIFCIDFGMVLKYTDKYGNHLHQENTNTFCGTEAYASISSHDYTTQSRRDDLESMFYNIVVMFKGSLPWSNLKEKDKKKRLEKVGKMKREMSADILCKDLPKEFSVFYKYIRNLGYYDKPHYTTLIHLFEKMLVANNYTGSKLQWNTV